MNRYYLIITIWITKGNHGPLVRQSLEVRYAVFIILGSSMTLADIRVYAGV